MRHKKQFPWVIVLILLLVFTSNGLVYYILQQDFSTKIKSINSSLLKLDNQVEINYGHVSNRLLEERGFSETQRELLEKRTVQNFVKLEDYFTKKTTTLQLNLESQLNSVENVVDNLEQRSDDLEGKISKIRVESADFSQIIGDVVKSVVSIKTDRGQGSGFFFDPDGYIMTNKHVISGAQWIQAVDFEDNVYAVDIIGFAQTADLAVLRLRENFTVDYLRFEDDANIGERVIAVGNPLGLSFTVTEGIVSATNREIDDTDIGYIQTDVSINPGNSGGPLLNTAGRVIGINTFKITAGEGLGFAIPADLAEDIGQQSVEN